jgi:uncharacterized protein (TIGR02271 family)
MNNSEPGVPVIGKNGLSGVAVGALPTRFKADDTVRIRLGTGALIEVPADVLVMGSDGTILIPFGPEDLEMQSPRAPVQNKSMPQTSASTEDRIVPVLAEELVIDKKRVQTGGVRVRRRVVEHEETIELPLVREHVDVRRVVIDREVDGPLPVRREGETTIIPVVEEVLVFEKRYRLKEEIHVIRTSREEIHREEVTVRRQEAEIERLDADGGSHVIRSPEVQSAREAPAVTGKRPLNK